MSFRVIPVPRKPPRKTFLQKIHKSSEKSPIKTDQYQVINADNIDKDMLHLSKWQRQTIMFLPYTATTALIVFAYGVYSQYLIVQGAEGPGALLTKPTEWNVLGSSNLSFKYLPLVFYVFASVFRHFELCLDVATILQTKLRPRLRLVGDIVPAVDVAIVCCKESIDVIRDTILAALQTDYPEKKLRLIVSDDGADADLELIVRGLQKQFPSKKLYYIAREKTPETSHKAGNLNFAFQYVKTLPGGPADYFSGLDADMIVEKRWLRASLAHLVNDPQMGYVCLPPLFYNIPDNDILGQSLLYFQAFEQRIKDMAGFAWCTGSGWTMRRVALNQIGGFPTQSLSEDLLCGTKIIQKGWKSAYVSEALQWGLAPDSYHAHVKQRKRWATGALQVGLLTRFCAFGEQNARLRFQQRAIAGLHPLRALMKSYELFLDFVAIAFLLRGEPIFLFSDREECKFLIRMQTAAFFLGFALKVQTVIVFGSTVGLQYVLRIMCAEHTLTVDVALDHLRTFLLPRCLGGRRDMFTARFTSTGSIQDSLHERDPTLRAPLLRRLKSVLISDLGIIHLMLAFGYILGVCLNLHRAYVLLHAEGATAMGVFLLTRVFWVGMAWPYNLVCFLRPLQYALFPPSGRSREDLLVRDKRGVAYPKAEARSVRHTGLGFGGETIYTLSILQAAGLFVAAYFI